MHEHSALLIGDDRGLRFEVGVVDLWNEIVALLSSYIRAGHCTFMPTSSALHSNKLVSLTASEKAYTSAAALLTVVTGCLLLRQCTGIPLSINMIPV